MKSVISPTSANFESRLFGQWLTCIGAAALIAAGPVQAADWPRFLGPNHDCKAAAADVAGFWPETGLDKQWEFSKGKGWSCPAVAGERVVVFHRGGTKEVVDCLELGSGKGVWHFEYDAPYRDRYGSGDGTKNNPVIADGKVWVFGITGRLHCLDLESGKMLWNRDLGADYAMRDNFFGHGSTPLILDGKVIVPVGGEGERCVAALDAATGREVWVAKHEWGAGYASAIPVKVGVRSAVLLFTGGETRPPTGGLLCIDAENGKVLGALPHRAGIAESVNASSPLLVGVSRVFTTEGYGSGGMLSEIGADGSLRKIWGNSKLGAQFHTPIARDGLILGFDGMNARLSELVCLDAASGEEKWREDFGGRFGRGNLVDLGEAGVLALGEFGELVRFKPAGSKAEIVQRVKLFEAPETWTMPVLSGRRLLVMQNERSRDGSGPRLICYKY